MLMIPYWQHVDVILIPEVMVWQQTSVELKLMRKELRKREWQRFYGLMAVFVGIASTFLCKKRGICS